MTIHEAIEEAFEQCGLEARSGYDLRTARRSLSLVLKRYDNRGLNFWQLEQYTLNLESGTASYAMPSTTRDLVLVSIKQGSTGNEVDLGKPLSVAEYHAIPNKTTLGRPVNWFLHRELSNPTLYLWPVPNTSDLILSGYRLRMDSVESTNDQGLSVPSRFEPAFIAELAAELALKKVDDPNRRAEMQARAKELWLEAERGDSPRSSFQIMPEVSW